MFWCMIFRIAGLLNFVGTLRCLFLLDRQQRINILLDGFHFPKLLLRCVIFRVQGFFPGSQFCKFSLHTISRGNGNSTHPFQFFCGSFKKDDLAFVTPEEFFLVRGSFVFTIKGLVFTVCSGILGNQGKAKP